MNVDLEQLRLIAALAHSAPDADVELRGIGRRWLVGYHRRGAAIDPCGLRRLVLAAARGCRVGLLPIAHVEFIGGLRDIGGGVFQRRGDHGMERRLATFLPAPQVEAILSADDCDAVASVTAHVHGDDELGVTVVAITSAHPVFDHRLDVVALRLVSACLVEELIQSIGREAAP